MGAVRIFRFYGLTETALRERLADVLHLPQLSAEIAADGWDITLRLDSDDTALLDEAAQEVAQQANVYLYSDDGSDLPTRVVRLLQQHDKTIAFAESCTGGMIASAITDVSGASQVFGTGVVSYSCTCKEKMLRVRRDTLRQYGAVSAQTAGEMARGVRAASGADIGVSVTGEAGPHPSEQSVGTVYIALADSRRTWVREWHLDAPDADRHAIRAAATGHALDLARRYLEAYPAVMAGADAPSDEAGLDSAPPRRMIPTLLPHRGDSRRKRALKLAAWLTALAVLVGGIIGIYHILNAPTDNRELQDSLRQLYSETVTADPLTEDADAAVYPEGMTARFRNLYDMNVNVAGWLRIDNTVIDYPVMLHCGGYYDNHSFTDEFSYYGQPYVDALDYASLMRDERVRIIYGNNTDDGQMFSSLLSYRRPAFLSQHPTVAFDTPFGTAAYEIFAVTVADGNERAVWQYEDTDFGDAEEYARYIAALRERSLFDSNVEVTAEDHLLLLSVDAHREYGHADARLVIAARRVTTDTATSDIVYRWNTDVRMPERWTRQTRPAQTTATAVATTAATTTVTTTTTTTSTTVTTTTTTTSTTTTTTTEEEEPTQTTVTLPDEDAGEDREIEEYDYTGD